MMVLRRERLFGALMMAGFAAWAAGAMGGEDKASQSGDPPQQAAGPASSGTAHRDFQPDQSQIPTPPPPDAIVLFDGKGVNLFLNKHGQPADWPVEDGVMTVKSGGVNHLVSRLHFRDAHIHVEFSVPEKGPGNSGIYIHGNYEMQIYNSYGHNQLTGEDVGAFYRYNPPLADAARKPGEWQVYDILYRAPRRNAEGAIVEPGAITAWLNGKKVQDGFEFREPRSPYHPFRYGTSPYLRQIWERLQKTSVGPLFLQDHGCTVRFRNIWVRPLDDKAMVYEAAEGPPAEQ